MANDYLPDDPHTEAAASRRYVPSENPKRTKYQSSPDDTVLKIRVDQQTYKDLLRIATKDDRGIEGFVRRVLKERIKDQRRADAINFLIARHAEIAELLDYEGEE
jgi:hypothetical protein